MTLNKTLDDSSQRFIKFIPSDEAFFLLHENPNAFRLLIHIANTARRYNGHPDGLIIGQCHLQHWTFYKLTERQYRTAKEILVKRKHIIIIETNRTRKKSTTGSTTSSTLVQLCSLKVWDINAESNDDRIDDRPTTDRRLTDDKQEGIRRNKKEEDIKPPPTSSIDLDGGDGGSKKSFGKIIFKNFKGEASSIDESAIFKHFVKLPYPTKIVEAAIEELRKSTSPVRNVFKFLEGICHRLNLVVDNQDVNKKFQLDENPVYVMLTEEEINEKIKARRRK
jgi:hypothetical protein